MMVRHGVGVQCNHCDYYWLYRGKENYPGMVLCPNCFTHTPLPEEAVDKEPKVI